MEGSERLPARRAPQVRVGAVLVPDDTRHRAERLQHAAAGGF
jgi:hypothetical protein